MTVRVRLALYAFLLGAVFAVGLAAGTLAGPFDDEPASPVPAHELSGDHP